MEKFNKFIDALKNTDYFTRDSRDRVVYNAFDNQMISSLNHILEEFDYKVVEHEGGCEGGGEYCYSVIRLGDEFYKAEWSYYSYSGDDYDSISDSVRQVKPVEKTITVYE